MCRGKDGEEGRELRGSKRLESVNDCKLIWEGGSRPLRVPPEREFGGRELVWVLGITGGWM